MRVTDPLVSICLPAYGRPGFLLEALESCFKQRYQHLEVVVTDDSPDDQVERAVRSLRAPIPLRYHRNPVRLGQANNWNRAIELARGERFVLLHDDDRLLPDAVTVLDAAWRAEPDLCVVYGKNLLIDHQGRPLPRQSERENARYHRRSTLAGRQAREWAAALLQQVPPNGYMMSTAVARSLRFSASPRVGNVQDTEFIFRLASAHRGFYFIDQPLSEYRLATDSLTSRGVDQHLLFELLTALDLPPALEPIRLARLRATAEGATSMWLRAGDHPRARATYFSRHYPPASRLTPRGLAYFAMLHAPEPWFHRGRTAYHQARRWLRP